MTGEPLSPDVSILEHIRAHPPGSGPRGETADLPDQGRPDQPGSWAPGAWDGVLTHHMNAMASPAQVERLVDGVRLATASRLHPRGWRPARRYTQLYRAAQDPDLVRLLDPMLDRVAAEQLPPRRVYELALRLATTGRHRGPVKLGIALLGLFPVAAGERELLFTLGRHDEFTLYAAIALRNGQPDAVTDLWHLARQVTGWGRIHLVEQLAASDRAEIRDWILREGFRNTVSDQYLALVAATCGDLAGRLRGEVDDQLLHAAGDILAALFTSGPVGDIADYDDGAAATELLVTHLREQARDLRHLLAVHAVSAYASRDLPDSQWPPGWARPVRQRLRRECTGIIARQHWVELVRAGLTDTDPQLFRRADAAARVLQISTLDIHLRLLRGGSERGSWRAALEQADPETIDEVLILATRLLPLSQIATGPAEEIGTGPAFEAHTRLGQILHHLDRWPGRGWDLLATGLASPVTNNRHLAVRALAAWPRDHWPPGADTRLRLAAGAEPHPATREQMESLLHHAG